MNPVNPEGNSGPLSLDEAVAAYANPVSEEEAPEGHAEPENEAEDEVLEASETEETEDEPEDEGQAEDEQPEEPAAPAYVAPDGKVKLEDGTETTVADLIKGNLRERDYRLKTAETGELRRTFEAKSKEVQQFEQQLQADRDFIIELTQSLLPQKPDPSMYAIDPIGYGEQKLAYDTRKEHLDYLLSVKQHLSQKAANDQAEQLKETRKREWEATLEALPELKDSTRLQSFVAELNKFGGEYGYSNEELQNVSLDHRHAVVLSKAIKWDKLQASKSKVAAKVEGRPPVQRGGTRQAPEAQRARDARVAMDRLKSTGSLRDGVAALLASEKG